MPYRRATVYYSTGTGNSYRAAVWSRQTLEAEVEGPLLASLTEAKPSQQLSASPDQLLVMVMPSHGFTAPWTVLKSVCRLPRRSGAHAAVVATRAGVKLGRLHPPGMSGSGTFIVALLLALRGYRTRGALSVNMPSNWFSLHPMQSLQSHRQITEPRR